MDYSAFVKVEWPIQHLDIRFVKADISLAHFNSSSMASVAQSDARPTGDRDRGHGFEPRRVRQNYFMEIQREMFSMVILSLPLVQEGRLSVFSKRTCISTR